MTMLDTAIRGAERQDALAEELGRHKPLEKPDLDRGWPTPVDSAAFYGIAGEFVRIVEPHTEADPVAMLSQFIVAFGNCVGRVPHYRVEGDRHHANLNVIAVGDTAKGRKGTSWGRVRQPFTLLEDSWAQERIMSGLSSGEGLIWQVRDPIYKAERSKKTKSTEEVMVDPGIDDKRLLVIEPEFASTLRVLGREGNTLSPLIRQAWDQGDLASMTKNSPAKASAAHISIIGHITTDELRRYLNRTEAGNGFANRFIFLCVRRSKCLPEGGTLSEEALRPIAQRLGELVGQAGRIERVTMDGNARELWHSVYPELSEGLPGLLGALTSRAEAQVVRLAMVYTLLDGCAEIQLPHLKAALAVWEYAEASTRYIFGDVFGDPVFDKILEALRLSGPRGLTRTEINKMFRRHQTADRIEQALDLLIERGLAANKKEPTEGRPREVWVARDLGT